jgi:hypothetical protein
MEPVHLQLEWILYHFHKEHTIHRCTECAPHFLSFVVLTQTQCEIELTGFIVSVLK